MFYLGNAYCSMYTSNSSASQFMDSDEPYWYTNCTLD